MTLEANPKDDIQVNKPEAAASLLDKAGKLLEKERPEDATGLYEKVWNDLVPSNYWIQILSLSCSSIIIVMSCIGVVMRMLLVFMKRLE